jgi:hypothetical protein
MLALLVRVLEYPKGKDTINIPIHWHQFRNLHVRLISTIRPLPLSPNILNTIALTVITVQARIATSVVVAAHVVAELQFSLSLKREVEVLGTT